MDARSRASAEQPVNEVDGWLRDGGFVIAASDRAARDLGAGFHLRRRAEGMAAWPAPQIHSWDSFVRTQWEQLSLDRRFLLNTQQERVLWAEMVGAEQQLTTLLEEPLHRLAEMAMEAHRLLCSYAPRFLQQAERTSWVNDAAAFSRWLARFDAACSAGDLLSAARAPLEFIRTLGADEKHRPPLLLVGFDRLLPVQLELLNAWGVWRNAALNESSAEVRYYAAADTQSELSACAQWCASRLAQWPGDRILIITQQVHNRRGEIERAFLRLSAPGAQPLFEFTLGIPLGAVPLARAAQLILAWLNSAIAENALDWLLSTGFITTTSQESVALQARMRMLRRKGLERTHWTLAEFLNQSHHLNPLPEAWARRMSDARNLLASHRSAPQSPLDWAALVPRLLQTIGFPGASSLSSVQFQAARRWQQVIDTCGSLGFDGRLVAWDDFLSALARASGDTLFAPESSGASILIAGPAESAGLAAGAVWFLGADEDLWPPSGSTHPFLPVALQRRFAMPHATPAGDWELADTIARRLIAVAPAVCFSFPMQRAGIDARPSRLVVQLAGSPTPIPADLALPPAITPLASAFSDSPQIPFHPDNSPGGSDVLTRQSKCAFQAFARFRLGAQGWEPAQAGLSAAQRGVLLHNVLHAVWNSPPLRDARNLEALRSLIGQGMESFVADLARQTMRSSLSASVHNRMPPRYLELEQQRLAGVVTQWLHFEAARREFAVAETEVKKSITIAGLNLTLRLDRTDRLNNGSLLVIDYKSGNPKPSSWNLPRPDDVQLPLYAAFALGDQQPGGLVFAKLHPVKPQFAGCIRDAKATLLPDLGHQSSLVKHPLTPEKLQAWHDCIEQLARDFLAGRADVNPRDYPATCKNCGLQSLCRVQEDADRIFAESGVELDEQDDDD
ncbi:MAG TPA: PD-(D/E)XK nuclease family protein [Terracidiphilus sp.]|nr:PD-(D/E)XK nuclease family protein [Terracidiphilus sp.]